MKTNEFAPLFLQKYPDGNHIVNYVRTAVGKENVLLRDLTRVNIGKICDVILESVTSNAAKCYFAKLKAFINLYKETGMIPCKDYSNLFKAKHLPIQNVFLTEDEIERLEVYLSRLEERDKKRCKDNCEIDVLHAFLAECYCGARGCDIADFTDKNFQDGHLVYVSKKTKVFSRVPIHKNLMKHINHISLKERASKVKDDVMKRVCEECHITNVMTLFYHGKMRTEKKCYFVGFHTARRSFATNLALRNVPVPVIAQMMNHGSDFQMTQRYIVADNLSLDDNTMAFFN